MRVPPSGSGPLHHTEKAAPTNGASISNKQFETRVTSAKSPASTTVVGAADIIEDVKEIAVAVRSGSISKEEASRRFISLVIEKRHDLSGLGSKGKQIEEAVKEIAGNDPHFVSKLQMQLQKLSKI